MLDDEQRQKLRAYRNDLRRVAEPKPEKKRHVYEIAKELNRSVTWVIRHAGGEVSEKHASCFLTTEEESRVREAHSMTPQGPAHDPRRLQLTLARLARDLLLPRVDVADEVTRRGVSREEVGPKLKLYTSEVDALLEFFARRWKWRQDHPVPYLPSDDGKISFEAYERIAQNERDELEKKGLLPSRLELSRHPLREWPQVRRHAAELATEPQLDDSRPSRPARPIFEPFPTTTSVGSSLIPKMKAVLDPMSPLGYAKFFSLMRALLALDAKISREIGSTPGYLATNRQNADIIDAVCKYGFGMFAYEQAGERLAKRAKSKPNPTRKNAIESLMRLRPMYQGLLTDVHHQRFVTWRVGEVWDFVEFRFEDMRDWLHGLETGQYVPLTTHITRVSGSSQLPSRDAALIKYMIQASENLREGNAQRTQDRSSRSAKSGEGRSNGRGSSTSNNRAVGYRAVNTWLVPINVVEGQVETELDRDFFNGSPPAPHQVRSFYRRPRGSGPNALKTEFVSAHTRGAKSLFHEPALLPSVTIVRK